MGLREVRLVRDARGRVVREEWSVDETLWTPESRSWSERRVRHHWYTPEGRALAVSEDVHADGSPDGLHSVVYDGSGRPLLEQFSGTLATRERQARLYRGACAAPSLEPEDPGISRGRDPLLLQWLRGCADRRSGPRTAACGGP
jgi:hypothetical protein